MSAKPNQRNYYYGNNNTTNSAAYSTTPMTSNNNLSHINTEPHFDNNFSSTHDNWYESPVESQSDLKQPQQYYYDEYLEKGSYIGDYNDQYDRGSFPSYANDGYGKQLPMDPHASSITNANSDKALYNTLVIKEEPTYCCGCFKRRSTCLMFWIGLIALLIAGIGLSVFFCFPRIINVTLSELYRTRQNGRSSFGIVGNPVTATTDEPYIVDAKVSFNITIDSVSFIDYKAKQVVIEGQPLNSNGQSLPIWYTSIVKDVTIRKKSKSLLVFPADIVYITDKKAMRLEDDLYIKYLLQNCKTKEGSMSVKFRIRITIGGLEWTGIKPEFEETKKIKCPYTAQELIDATKKAKSSKAFTTKNRDSINKVLERSQL